MARIAPFILLTGLLAAAVVLALVRLARCWHRVAPNEVLVVFGRRPMRIARRGTFVWPVLELAERLSLEVLAVPVHLPSALAAGRVLALFDAVAEVRIDPTSLGSITAAAERFLGRPLAEVGRVAGETIERHARALLSSMEVTEVDADRVRFTARLQEVASMDLQNLGLQLVSLTVRDVREVGRA